MNSPTPTNGREPGKSRSISDYVPELKSQDATRRRRAIIALGKTGDPSALTLLSDVFHNDPSVELRELARQAGLYIRQQTEKHEENPVVRRAMQRKVTEADVRRAKGYTDQALTWSIEGDNGRAVQSLYKALLYNPALSSDTYFTGIAATLLNVPASEAIALLKDADQRGDFARTTERSRRSAAVEQHMEEARSFTWKAVSFELAFYLLVCAFGPVLMTLVIAQSMQQLLAQGATATEGMPDVVGQLSSVVGIGGSLPALLTIAVVCVLSGLINLLAQTALIHVVARYLLRGKGTFAYLLSKITPLLARYLLVVFLASSLAVGIGLGGGAFFLIYIVGFGLALFSLFTLIKLTGQIGKAYHVGAGVGCASILLAAVALGILNGLMSSILSQTLADLLSRFVPPT